MNLFITVILTSVLLVPSMTFAGENFMFTARELYNDCVVFQSIALRENSWNITPQEYVKFNNCMLIAEGAKGTATVFYINSGGEEEIKISTNSVIERFIQDITKLDKNHIAWDLSGSVAMGTSASNIIFSELLKQKNLTN